MKSEKLGKILALFTLVATCSLPATTMATAKTSFWNIPQGGTNQFNQRPTEEWFAAAAEADIEWVRVAFGKWDGKERDFLAGSLDNYQGLIQEDLAYLNTVLSWAEKHQIKVVLTPLGLPGARLDPE